MKRFKNALHFNSRALISAAFADALPAHNLDDAMLLKPVMAQVVYQAATKDVGRALHDGWNRSHPVQGFHRQS
jgi:hypothetical protein